MAGFAGPRLDEATELLLGAGGRAVILYSRNIESRQQLNELTTSIACAAAGPVIVAVDQEPGLKNRLSVVGISAPELTDNAEEFAAHSSQMARDMVAIGVNLDLAPIADVVLGDNPVLEGRNFGPDSELVAERAVEFIAALAGHGVGSTAKHFPGHGLSQVDPHDDVTVIDAELETLQDVHFPPFLAAIAAGVDAVMVGHPIYEALDPATPASLSPSVFGMLRDDFEFDGVALTDGLSMAALRKTRTIQDIAVEAITAGADLLLADETTDVPLVIDALLRAIATGELSESRLREAANRVRSLASRLAHVECDEGR